LCVKQDSRGRWQKRAGRPAVWGLQGLGCEEGMLEKGYCAHHDKNGKTRTIFVLRARKKGKKKKSVNVFEIRKRRAARGKPECFAWGGGETETLKNAEARGLGGKRPSGGGSRKGGGEKKA